MITAQCGTLRAIVVTAALACLIADGAYAQHNPFASLKDAVDKAKQQLQQATGPAPSAPTAVAPTVPASLTPAPISISANIFVPPTDEPSKPAGLLDPANLMDIAGVRIGMPIAETVPILKRIHPEATLQPDTLVRGEPMAAYRFNVWMPQPTMSGSTTPLTP
jgi:hypothetical protein